MYENTTSQYKNIYQEKQFQIYLLSLYALLQVAYPNKMKFLNHALRSQSGVSKFHL